MMRRRLPRILLVVALVLTVAPVFLRSETVNGQGPTSLASPRVGFVVDTVADTPDASPGDGFCEDSSGLCSLRAAVMEANGLSGEDSIEIASDSPITVSFSSPIAVNGDLIITGPGVDLVYLSGTLTVQQGNVSISDVKLGSIVTEASGVTTLTDVHVTTGGTGRAIRNRGTMHLQRVEVYENVLQGLCYLRNDPENEGGMGIFNTGAMTLDEVTVRDNEVRGDGCITSFASYAAGIYNMGSMTITNSLVRRNTTFSGGGGGGRGLGGGIANTGDLTLLNSTVTQNKTMFWKLGVTQRSWGGGIYNDGTLRVFFSTIASNTARGTGAFGRGGGVYNAAGAEAVVLKATILANNWASNLGPDCYDSLSSLGYNLLGDLSSCNVLTQATDLDGADPLLTGPADHGGPTLTYAPGVGSPVLDIVPEDACTDRNGDPAARDQRGYARPGDLGASDKCDTGAYEAGDSVAGGPPPGGGDDAGGGGPSLPSGPRVLDTIPRHGAEGVLLDALITVTFDRELDPATVTHERFLLREGFLMAVLPSSVVWSSADDTVTIVPTADLAPGTTHMVTVERGVRSAEGVPMTTDYTFSFVTLGEGGSFLPADPNAALLYGEFQDIADMVVSLSGVLAAISFAWGGYTYMTAAGTPQRMEQGRNAMLGALSGLLLVLLSRTIAGIVIATTPIVTP